MNIIVTNQNKELIMSTNIEIMKELNGVFQISEIANSFNSIFYRKLIIDATALANFPKRDVITELAKTFDTEKLILFLPPDNPPPKKFLSFLISNNIYNFTDNAKGLIELVNKSNTYDDVKEYANTETPPPSDNTTSSSSDDLYDTSNGKTILGICNVNKDAGSTSLTYLMKKNLEEVYQKNVVAVEIDKKDFVFYNSKGLYSIPNTKMGEFFSAFENTEIILVDLADSKSTDVCTDVIYLVDPSLYKINQLLMNNRGAFNSLKGKKVVLTNSLLSDQDVEVFSREAGISVYFNLQPLNDRIVNPAINSLLSKLGLIELSEMNNKKGLFGIFNK